MPPEPSLDASSFTPVPRFHHVRTLARKHHRKTPFIIIGVALYLSALSVVLQLIYPADWALPGTRLAGDLVGLEDASQIRVQLQQLDHHALTLRLAGKDYIASPQAAGLSFANEDDVQAVVDYPVDQRLIPFSMFFERQPFRDSQLRPTIDEQKMQSFASQLVAKSTTMAVEGVIDVRDGQVHEHQPQPGTSFSSADIVDQLKTLNGSIPSAVTIAGTTTPPRYSARIVHIAAMQAARLIQPLTVTVDGTPYRIPAAAVGGWLTLTPNNATNAIVATIDHAKVAAYLVTIALQRYQGPTGTVVTLLDGHETERQVGKSGHYLDTTAAANTVASALEEHTGTVKLALSTFTPPLQYIRQYSNSQAGLQALVDYLVATKGTYGITVHEISSRGWAASTNGGQQFVTASTYKLFVAYSTLRRIENGSFQWTDSTNGTTLSTCMSRMIINSDNACAVALGTRIGWATVIKEVNDLGLHATTRSDTFHSTTNDESLLLTKLATGSILTDSSRASLLNMMEQQHYRSGIPAGTGVLVADKVGFLTGLLHDAAIVYGPKSTYVLVIMTDHSSWSQIADTAKQIQTQMSR